MELTQNRQFGPGTDRTVMFGGSHLALVAGSVIVRSVRNSQVVNALAVVLIEGKSRKTHDVVGEAQRESVLGPLDLPGQVVHLAAQDHLLSEASLDVVGADAERLLLLGIGQDGTVAVEDDPEENCSEKKHAF